MAETPKRRVAKKVAPMRVVKQPLSVTHPELAKQAVGWDPSTVTRGSDRKRLWKCNLGHEWDATVSSRVGGAGCPVCVGRKILVGFNDLAFRNPTLAAQAFDWDPSTVTPNTHTKKLWQCPLGHKWEAAVSQRSSGTSCPICSGHKVLIGFNDLATVNPTLAAEAVNWDPATITQYSSSVKLWRCEFGHKWKALVSDRSAGHGCPICSGNKVLKGFNDLASISPLVATQAFGWDPSTVTKSSMAKKDWLCEQGHKYKATIATRYQGHGCSICTGQEVLKGFNDLETVNPLLAAQASGWDPSTVTRSAASKKKWLCERGHEFQATVNSRSGGSGCPFCSGNKVLKGFNDLATVNPLLAAQASGWDPRTVTFGSNSKRDWICESGHQWKADVKSRSNGIGCPSCTQYGFDPSSNGWLYFLNHPQWEMSQVGITNFPDQRLGNHKKLGWELIELRGPMDGLIAREWETSILQMLKRHGAKLAPEEVVGKFDGYTEAWLTNSHPVKSLRELMEKVRKDEARNESLSK